MRCAQCGSDNPDDKRFCGDCGASLASRCPKCEAENPSDKKFCGDCGASLVQKPISGEGPVPVVSVQPTGERRHLTVLFCDLAGSTALAAGLDPEDWRATIAAYHRAAAEAITRLGGHVAKYLGDGVMAFFGYPEAHDNDAERATRAGLAILEGLVALNESSAHPHLAARIGIDSGPVVVGVGAGSDADVFGDVPNIAARVQTAADRDSVFVSAATHRLISGLFITEDRSAQPLKGIAEPLQLFRVMRPSGARGRLEATAAARGLTPFVGRDDELRMLTSRWERARDGEGQVALIIGEAGIGKSRLLHRFRETLTGTPHSWIDAAAGAFFQNTPFYPVTEMLRQLVWVQSFNRLDDYLRNLATSGTNGSDHNPDPAPAEKVPDEPLAQVLSGLAQAGLSPALSIPLLAPLLNLALPPEYAPSPLPPDQQRRRLLATLVAWILGSARTQPLIIVIEDLHWADPSTLELIQLLVEQGNTAHLMLLYTARPEFRPPWPLRSHHAQINLNRLNARDVRTIVAQVAAQKALADETVAAVVDRTGGIPLFVEELTRVLLERGDARPTGREIPATLHDSLIARLDRLGPARETLQIAAVLGSDFSYELLHAVHPAHDHDELQRHLLTLTDAELLYVRGLAPDATYQFKHALIRDAAYEALLKSRRKELHRLVAQTIDSRFPAIKEKNPEVLAYHWTEAGDLEPAIAAWTAAAEYAESRNAFKEAQGHYEQALDLLSAAPESTERAQRELRLQMALGNSLVMLKGQGAPEAGEAYARALELCRKFDETPRRLFPVLGALSVFHMARGEPRAARELLDQLLPMANNLQTPELLLLVHYGMGVVLLYLGELPQALTHLEQAIAFYDPAKRRSPSAEDPILGSLSMAAFTLWQLGYPDRALEKARESVILAQKLSYPYGLCITLQRAANLSQLRGEVQATREQAESVIALAQEQGFTLQGAIGHALEGWALAKLGRNDQGIKQMEKGLAAAQAVGGVIYLAGLLAILAEVYSEAGQLENGLETIAKAFDLTSRTENAVHEPRLYLLKGELLLRQSDFDAAQVETAFRLAIAIARNHSAKSWELHATTSLARLLRNTSRRDEAHSMLSTIYNWFTEGFDTRDLIDAKALLDELST